MTAISIFRRRRAFRFAAFGAYIGAGLMVTMYVTVVGLGWLVNVHPGYDSRISRTSPYRPLFLERSLR